MIPEESPHVKTNKGLVTASTAKALLRDSGTPPAKKKPLSRERAAHAVRARAIE